jgi:peptide/histidine transporter 3/4
MSAASEPDSSSKPVSFYLSNVLNMTYKPRRFRHKGALLTLLWNFLVLCLFVFILTSRKVYTFNYNFQIGFGVTAVIFPVAGWVADVYVGRYRMLKYSIFVMWAAAILNATAVVLRGQFPSSKAPEWYMLFTVILGMVGITGFQSNTLQFGVDQLVEASSRDISSYISWYGWMFFVSTVVTEFSQSCICGQYEALLSLVLPALLTVCLCSDLLFNHWLIKEPAGFNPLKLIFKVLRFAAKNKYPLQRSAFTYWEDKPYTRMDLAKQKYGGPFTTEQVEDVKTFFRLLVILILGSLFSGIVFVVNSTVSLQMMRHFHDPYYTSKCTDANFSSRDCFERVLVDSSSRLIMVVLVPVYELIVYPLAWKCSPRCTIMNKFALGVFFQFCYHVGLTVLEIVGHQMTSQDPSLGQNYNVTCMLKLDGTGATENSTLILSYKWLVVPMIFSGMSVYCLLTSSVEFFSAQSPYSMKGLVGGLAYCMCGIAVLLSLGAKSLFRSLFKKNKFGEDIKLGCGVWFFLSVSLLTLIWILVVLVATKCYRRRRRDENVHNEHIFAVNYYS